MVRRPPVLDAIAALMLPSYGLEMPLHPQWWQYMLVVVFSPHLPYACKAAARAAVTVSTWTVAT
jgi:hypothetical protein